MNDEEKKQLYLSENAIIEIFKENIKSREKENLDKQKKSFILIAIAIIGFTIFITTIFTYSLYRYYSTPPIKNNYANNSYNTNTHIDGGDK